MAELIVRNVRVDFAAPDHTVLPALGPVNCRVNVGEFVCLVGPSGCGKSTLIRAIAGLQPITTGEILLDDVVLTEPSSRIGLMFQDANLMPWRSVLDNIALPLELAGQSKAQRHQLAAGIIPTLGLEGFKEALPGELSGGMAQRTALGRLLVQRPDVLLLDEPFGALDAMTREKISFDLLRIQREHHHTVLMVTHDINEAVFLSDRVLVMSQRPGKIIADIDVELPRPRRLELMYETAFSDAAKRVRAALNAQNTYQ